MPHFYLTIDIRLDPLLELRAQLNKSLEPDGVKLSVNDLLIKALARALITRASYRVLAQSHAVLAVGFPMGVTAFRENFIVHGIYLLVIATMLVVGWVSLAYLNINRDDLVRYKNLQVLSLGAVVAAVLAAVFIKVTWAGVYV